MEKNAIKITHDLRVVADFLGGMRSLINRRSNVGDAKIGPQDGVQADKDAVLGELAFARWKNVYPDLSLAARSGSYDLIVNGYKFDVKTTRYVDGRLLATTKKNPDVDIFALAILLEDRVVFPGYALAEELYRDERLLDLGHGAGYAMAQAELRKWKDG